MRITVTCHNLIVMRNSLAAQQTLNDLQEMTVINFTFDFF